MRGKYDSKIPVPGDRFSYVVTHPENTFDLHGRKLTPTKGEKMEFADMAKELGKELDLYAACTARIKKYRLKKQN